MVRAGACSPSSAPSLNALEIVSAIREGLEVGVSKHKLVEINLLSIANTGS